MILVLGASGGIGQFLAETFIKHGNEVKGTFNSQRKGVCQSSNFVQLDITNFSEIEVWLKSIEDSLKDITLVNCVGINYNCFGHKADLDVWKNVVDVNLVGTFNVIRAILPYMRNEKFGRIINLSSIVPQVGVPGTSAYAASKSGLWGMTRSLAKENASLGITINTLNLGYIDSGMIDSVPMHQLEKIISSIPANRLGNPSEVYRLIQTLIDVEYLNGASIDLNGGL
jgi:NAD(P)-dependent dehydrogenase (short-subunit alcohol dehydrogenase family)